jgi:hypothetical protein
VRPVRGVVALLLTLVVADMWNGFEDKLVRGK